MSNTKLIIGLIGDPIETERDLKQDFATRFFDTDALIIVLDGETYDGSYARTYGDRLADGVSFSFADVPKERPEGKRLIVIHTECFGSNSLHERSIIQEKGWARVWQEAVETISAWSFDSGHPVYVYAVNDVVANTLPLRDLLDALPNVCNIFWQLDGLGSKMKADALRQLVEQSSTVAVCGDTSVWMQSELHEAFPQYKEGTPYALLKNDAGRPLYANVNFHSWVNTNGILLVPIAQTDAARMHFIESNR